MKEIKLPPICLIISSKEIPEKAEIALKTGIKWIQYREKDLPRKDILENAFRIKEIISKYDGILTINDHVDIAIVTESEGIHLGQDDLPIYAAKKIFSGIIGISTHNLQEADEAKKGCADYIGFGPMFRTITKKDALEPRECYMLSLVCKKMDIPVVAIGGINVYNINMIKETGCRYVAVSSGILQGDMKTNIEKFLKVFM
jgi:thiamine-phosphate pyrophosphorylase